MLALLYTLVAEPLGLAINGEKEIKGILIEGNEIEQKKFPVCGRYHFVFKNISIVLEKLWELLINIVEVQVQK